MTQDGNWLNAVVAFILGGGLIAAVREFRDWLRDRQRKQATAPEKRAAAESRLVATAESVVELVEERMQAQSAEIKELQAQVRALGDEVVSIRRRADRAERRVETLTRLIRDNAPHIEIPPEETP